MVRKITPLITAALLLVGSISLKAAEEKNALVVRLKDGTEVQFIASEKLTVTNNGNDVVFKSTTATATYPRSNVAKFYFKPAVLNSVEKIQNEQRINFLMQRDYILITSTEKLTKPMIYNINGMMLATSVNQISNNSATISVSSLPRGIYIVTANKQSFKFIKK
jgi:hypothetical protein